jgi:hypothetical protein
MQRIAARRTFRYTTRRPWGEALGNVAVSEKAFLTLLVRGLVAALWNSEQEKLALAATRVSVQRVNTPSEALSTLAPPNPAGRYVV